MWKPIANSSNCQSSDGKYIAIYKHSFCGLPCYWVFPITEKKRIQKNAVCIGGLPDKNLLARLNSGD